MSRRSSNATSRRADVRSQRGVSLVALVASVTIMLIGMGMAAPGWNYVIGYENEQQLIFVGFEIVKGIRSWQVKQGGTFPTSLEHMVKQKVLRQQYKDPVTASDLKIKGQWTFI